MPTSPQQSEGPDWSMDEPDEADGAAASTTEPAAKPMTRLERLREKVRRLQGKNPDIYPMW